MTPVGHTLTGLAVGISALPSGFSWKNKMIHFGLFVLLANVPDWPIPYWGHDQYWLSHSIFVNLVLFVLLGWLFRKTVQKVYHPVSPGMFFLFVGIAWFSHLLLDSFYNHGLGVRIWWPFSDRSLCLPIPWFSVQQAPIFPVQPESLRIWGIEFLSYSPLILVAVMIRRIIRNKRTFQGNYRGK